MSLLAHLIYWINIPVNVLGRILLAPVGIMPGWLSLTLLAALTGVILLIIFKHTSNQQAIERVKNSIKADMLAPKLFKDSLSVLLISQVRIFRGCIILLLLSIPPLLVMILPVTLLLVRMAGWYQARPLPVGEETVVTLKLNGDQESAWPGVSLEASDAVEPLIGPVRVLSQRELCWKIQTRKKGRHRLTFRVDQQRVHKELAVGEGFMRISARRPGPDWYDVLIHPQEKPFASDSPVQSIQVEYPKRSSGFYGSDGWLISFFIASLIFAFLLKPFLKVKI
jgi:hypothetical protein